jgi:signal transduction histidine kinase
VTRRILASFLGVLVGLLALVVVPLGVSLAAQQRQDFARSTDGAARALAGVVEERLGDRAGAAGSLQVSADAGDVLDSGGRQLIAVGRPISPRVVALVRARRGAQVADAVVSTAVVGDAGHRDGTVILVRDAEPLDHRIRRMWLGLAAAAGAALAVGALVAAALARWIGRPLRDLRAVAVRMGEGDVGARTAERPGPPEVRAVAVAFNDMAGRIGSLLDSQRIMTLDVSHQLRTPLAALRLRLELLADDGPDELRGDLLDALREIARLSRLADGLLAVARAEEVTASPAAVDVAAIVAERVGLWEPVAAERGVTLGAQQVPAAAWANPGHIEQVLDNLIANALDALSTGNRVDVSVQTEPGQVVLRVTDDGPGMSQERREAAFGRFVSDRSAPTKTGLGLAIVARLVAADHGSTTLDQTAGGGLTAVVRLPAADGNRRSQPPRPGAIVST